MDCVHMWRHRVCPDCVPDGTFDNQLCAHDVQHVICLLNATFYTFIYVLHILHNFVKTRACNSVFCP
jgi:hypothetical protein